MCQKTKTMTMELDLPDSHESDIVSYTTIRAKWAMDGARTVDEAIIKLYNYIDYLRRLKEDGWELSDAVEDDYGTLEKRG